MAPEGVYEAVRSHFAYFQRQKESPKEYAAFMENAGGSQVPRSVVDTMAHYLTACYAQLGAGHPASNRATATVDAAHEWARVWVNMPREAGEVMIGPSTSMMLNTLAGICQQTWQAGDEVLLQEACHESNINPWLRAAKAAGATVKWWGLLPDADAAAHAASGNSNGNSAGNSVAADACDVSRLIPLLNERTRLVAVTHVSNLLGDVLDVAEVVRVVRLHAPRARVVVDGVAFAPHRCIDVLAWGVDFYVFSAYKVYGPHMSVMAASRDAIRELRDAGAEGPNHYFVSPDDWTYKFELGGVNHEGCAGLLGTQPYMRFLADVHTSGCALPPVGEQQEGGSNPQETLETLLTRQEVVAATQAMRDLEQPLLQHLLKYVSSRPDIIVLGRGWEASGVIDYKMPTIAIMPRNIRPRALVQQLQARGFGVRHGHNYAARLVTRLLQAGQLPTGAGLSLQEALDEGVVRISLLHYNTPGEVQALTQAMDEILDPLAAQVAA